MPKKSKLKGITFQLVHRSQQDPSASDETAPQRVLVPVLKNQSKAKKDFDQDEDYESHLKDSKDNYVQWPEHVEELLAKRRMELEKAKRQLPSSVFAGEINKEEKCEEEPLDSDVEAAMEEDFDFDDPDNQLEDDFVKMADGANSEEDYNCKITYLEEDGDGDVLKLNHLSQNEHLERFNDKYDKMFDDDDDDFGLSDSDDEDMDTGRLLEMAEKFEKRRKMGQRGHLEDLGSIDQDLKKKILSSLEKGSSKRTEKPEYIQLDEKPKFNCQSAQIRRSVLFNQPKLIPDLPSKSRKIQINEHTGLPEGVFNANKLTKRALDSLEESSEAGSHFGRSVKSQLSLLSVRPKGETPSEKYERKRLLKIYKKERRLEKKINSKAFKDEAIRQGKIAINNRNNVQGNRIL